MVASGSNPSNTEALGALDAALARAKRHAAAAAAAAAVVPLTAFSAHASVVSQSPYSVTTQTYTSLAGVSNVIEYTVNAANGSLNVSHIEIPEISLGDLNFNVQAPGNSGSAFFNNFWTASEVTSSELGASLKSGTPAGYIELTQNNGYELGGPSGSSSLSFYAQASTLTTTNSNFVLGSGGTASYTIDPPIPNSAPTSVPEPASAAVFGAGLLTLLARRRRKAA